MKRHLRSLLLLAVLSSLVVWSPTSGNEPGQHDSGPVYNLTPRYQLGQKSFYRFTITQHILDLQAEIVTSLRQTGKLSREVVKIRDDGSAVEKITWKGYSMSVGKGRSGPWGEPLRPPWAENFSYLFAAEDSHEDFHWDYSSIPVTAPGDGFMMHTVNSHFEFDFLRSRAHGAIDQLRRVGDTVIVPDTDRPFDIHLRASPQSWTCIKRDHTMTFVGFSDCGGRRCAVLRFWTWLDVQAHLGEGEKKTERKGHTQFDGHLYVDPEDGSLFRGDFDEWVILPTLGSTGDELIRVYVEYRIERIAPEAFGSTEPEAAIPHAQKE